MVLLNDQNRFFLPLQIALTDLLSALGVTPDGIIGHSVGEFGCAYADGCFTAEQMLMAAYYRGKASLEATLVKGMMAAIGKYLYGSQETSLNSHKKENSKLSSQL